MRGYRKKSLPLSFHGYETRLLGRDFLFLMKKGTVIIWICSVLAVLALAQCSTKKNTWASRSYHYTKAKYNVMFNGRQAFEKGVKAVWAANKDNYGVVLPLDAISNHENASAAKSDMGRTIENKKSLPNSLVS